MTKRKAPEDKLKAGRPLKYEPDPEGVKAFSKKCDEYFVDCDLREAPYTIPGLAYFLGFLDRHSVINYTGKPAFYATLKAARSRIERQRVENLVSGKGSCPGQIFDLKNNFDYKDKIETAVTGADGGPVEIKHTKFELVKPNNDKN